MFQSPGEPSPGLFRYGLFCASKWIGREAMNRSFKTVFENAGDTRIEKRATGERAVGVTGRQM